MSGVSRETVAQASWPRWHLPIDMLFVSSCLRIKYGSELAVGLNGPVSVPIETKSQVITPFLHHDIA